jgi:hypothetical protein
MFVESTPTTEIVTVPAKSKNEKVILCGKFIFALNKHGNAAKESSMTYFAQVVEILQPFNGNMYEFLQDIISG